MSRPTLSQRLQQLPSTRLPVEPLQTQAMPVLDFASPDYLGLARHFQVLGALQDWAARQGMQADGHSREHTQLEAGLADWLGFPAARSYQSLAQARLAVQQALLTEEEDLCLHDHLNNPALIQATHLTGSRLRHYPHRDAEGAAWQLRQAPRGLALLVSEGLFQADGQLAPLRTLALVAQQHQAHLLVDDVHAIGVCGEQGGGSLEATGLAATAVTALVISLEHALGLQGAVVLAGKPLIEQLERLGMLHQHPRPPTAIAAAAQVSLKLARRDGWRRQRVLELAQQLQQRLASLGINAVPSPGPLLCLEVLGEASHWQAALARRGLRVIASPDSRDPGTPMTRLRLQLSALHDSAQLDPLAESIARLNDSARLNVPLLQPQEV